jgi:glycosyltransferase involved in cell wall biosynthesis
MKNAFRFVLKFVFSVTVFPVFMIMALVACVISRVQGASLSSPRLFWGSVPIINNSYWSRSMRNVGFDSETFTTDFYSINAREDWDLLLSEKFAWWPERLRPYLGFIYVLVSYDILFFSFQGVFIGTSPFWRVQAPLMKLAGKRIVVIPFGGDAYIYRRTNPPALTHGLLMSYPDAARQQNRIAKRVDYWCSHAEVIIPGFMGPDGIGRWDVLLGSLIFIDLDIWKASKKAIMADARAANEFVVCHAPNHRGFKGTEFVIQAVQVLRSEGLNIRLILLEGLPNSEVRRVLNEEADVLVEQLIFTGHGLNGLEGMASGIPVVSNLEDEDLLLPYRRWSFFSECPIVSASPETITDVIRSLAKNPKLCSELGKAGRDYVEKYHGLDSSAYLFTEVLEYLQGNRESLINLYHPLLGEYTTRSPRIECPLKLNRIIE